MKGQAAEKVLVGNRLLVFSVQFCFVLHAERHYFSIENPLDYWTWAVAAVARLHAMPGVATVQVCTSAREPRPDDRLARSVLVKRKMKVQELTSVTIPAVNDKVDGKTNQ